MYNILIVDDEKAIRDNLPKAIDFNSLGYYVCGTASNGEEAMKRVKELLPDVILLDVCMPVMNGVEFIKELRGSEYKDIIVILLSGHSDFHYAKEMIKYGAKRYLTKPVDDELEIILLELRAEIQKKKNLILQNQLLNHLDLLHGMYEGKVYSRELFKNYFLLHCVVLSNQLEEGGKHSFQIIRHYMRNKHGTAAVGFFKERGSVITYLISKDALGEYSADKIIFSKHILKELREQGLNCSLLLDDSIFLEEIHTFREDYSEHLYTMLSKVFYGMGGVLIYHKKENEPEGCQLAEEEEYLDNIKQAVEALRQEDLESILEELEYRLYQNQYSLIYIQKLNYKIYYMLMASLPASGKDDKSEPLFLPIEWRETSVFFTFEEWITLIRNQILEIFTYMKQRRTLHSMGICGNMIEYIRMHYQTAINLGEIADKYHINPAYLGRIFQKATGMTFKKYINRLRIEEAKRLLSQTDKLIYEIADCVGYKESKYFITRFISEVGISPNEYRKQMFNNRNNKYGLWNDKSAKNVDN